MRAKTTTRATAPGRSGGQRSGGARSIALWTALGIALLLGSGTPPAALGIDDITPLFFQPGGGQGFDPADVAAIGRTPNLEATPADLFLGAGGPSSGASVQVTSQVITTVHALPGTATPEDPAIVDSTWTIENISAGALSAPVLLFTVLDPLDTYPGDPQIGLDADLLSYMPSAGPQLVYGAIVLPDLGRIGRMSGLWCVR